MGENNAEGLIKDLIDFRLNEMYIYVNNNGDKIVLRCVREKYISANGEPTYKFKLIHPLSYLEDANIYRLAEDPNDVYSLPVGALAAMETKGGLKIRLLRRREWAKMMLMMS